MRLFILLVSGTMLAHGVWASPTANEFAPCHRGAAWRLQHCLSEAGMNDGAACWPQVQTYHRDCRKAVVRQHQPPDAARVEAAREAERKRQAAQGVRR